jgi:apyrase
MINHLILDATEFINLQVRDLLREKSSFKNQPDWVTVLDGSQEGAYEWVRCWPYLSINSLNYYFAP